MWGHAAVAGRLGAAQNGTNFDHRTFANLPEHDPSYPGGPIRLPSSSTGKLPDGAAQNLANKLGVTVVAPTDTLWAYPSGRLTVGSTARRSSGSTDLWNVFEPGNSFDVADPVAGQTVAVWNRIVVR